MQDEDELIDIVDENDQVIGAKTRKEIYDSNIRNFRVVNGFLVNSKGKLWIPRRTADKAYAPLGLDMSVGGHVGSGESYDEAFVRETAEELNIDLTKTKFKEIGYHRPTEFGAHCFGKVYEIRSDTTPNYNQQDFIEAAWMDPIEVIERVKAGDAAKGDLTSLIRHFYLNADK